MHWMARLVLLFILILVSSAESLAKNQPASDGDIIYYLSGDSIRSVTLPNTKKATVVFKSPTATALETYEISGLSCGPDNNLAFNLVHTPRNPTDFSKPVTRVTIESFNPTSKELKTVADEGEGSARFPVFSYDGSLLSMTAYDLKRGDFYFLIKNLKDGSFKRYDQLKPAHLLGSLAPDNRILAMTGFDDKTKHTRIYFIDLNTMGFSPWLEGMTPIFSPDGKLIAYTTQDHEKIIISDRNGKRIQSYEGYLVKDFNGWIDNTRIVFTIGHFMYTNHIGIVDLVKKRIYDLKVPTSGEISGICYRPATAVETKD